MHKQMSQQAFLSRDFIWGFATASAQIEGGSEETERANRGLSVSCDISSPCLMVTLDRFGMSSAGYLERSRTAHLPFVPRTILAGGSKM